MNSKDYWIADNDIKGLREIDTSTSSAWLEKD